jgi:hypothetical protein
MTCSSTARGAAGFAVLTAAAVRVWARRLCRLRLLRARSGLLRAGLARALGEHVAARQRDAALAREPLDELARDDLFDRARALFSSMPCARFSSASTSWLLVLRSSATL